MRRLCALITVAAAIAETYRRGYAGYLLYGARQWCRARPDRYYQPDVIA